MPCDGCTPVPCNDFLPLLSSPTTLPACDECEKCEETVDGLCTVYTGPNLPVLGVTNGMRLKAILVLLNKNIALGSSPAAADYTITVALGNTATVEYLNGTKDVVSVTVPHADSPVTISAITGSPVLISGIGTIALV